MVVIPVDDPDDPRLADYRHLTDAELWQRAARPDPSTADASGPERPAAASGSQPGAVGAGRRSRSGGRSGVPGIFIAESLPVIRHLLRTGHRERVRSLLVTARRHADLVADPAVGRALTALDLPVLVGPPEVLQTVTGFDAHRGALAAVDRPPPLPPSALIASARHLAVVEGVNDLENMGVIFRNAAGLGLDGVLLDRRSCEPFYRRVVRVSMGHVLSIPSARLASFSDGLHELREAGFTLVALTPDRSATPLQLVDVGALDRVAVLLGAEGPGLSDEALGTADLRVRIPMVDAVDSLNVASAAAVAFAWLRLPT